MLRRVLAWLALIFLLAVIVNILFIHVLVTESVIVFCLYVLVFFFGSNRNKATPNADMPETVENLAEDAAAEASEEAAEEIKE